MSDPPAMHDRHLAAATVVSAVLIVVFMLYGYRNEQGDDAYIFYSYAQNLANGNGYVFNVGERVNATTSPLYTLLLAGLYWLLRGFPSITIPFLGQLIGAVSLLLLSLALMRSFDTEGGSLFPYTLPLVFLASPLLTKAVGMETYLALMLGVVCLDGYVRNKLTTAALACSFAVLARPDMLLPAAALVCYHLIRYRRLPTLRMLAFFLLPIAAWGTFSLLYFGSVVPSTLAAKLAQTEGGLWGTGLIFLKGLSTGYGWYGGMIIRNLLAAAVIAGLAVWSARFRTWAIFRHPVFHVILIWNLVYVIAYGLIMQAPAYAWYYTPLALGVSLLTTLPIEGLYRGLSNRSTLRRQVFVPAVYVALIAGGLVLPLVASRQPVRPTYVNHKLAAEWLNENAPEGSSVGTNDIGAFRYLYKKGPVVDGVGLVTSGMIEHIRRREYSWYIHEYQPDYLLFYDPPRSVIERIVSEEWFHTQYDLRMVFRTAGLGLALYERRPSRATTA